MKQTFELKDGGTVTLDGEWKVVAPKPKPKKVMKTAKELQVDFLRKISSFDPWLLPEDHESAEQYLYAKSYVLATRYCMDCWIAEKLDEQNGGK